MDWTEFKFRVVWANTFIAQSDCGMHSTSERRFLLKKPVPYLELLEVWKTSLLQFLFPPIYYGDIISYPIKSVTNSKQTNTESGQFLLGRYCPHSKLAPLPFRILKELKVLFFNIIFLKNVAMSSSASEKTSLAYR